MLIDAPAPLGSTLFPYTTLFRSFAIFGVLTLGKLKVESFPDVTNVQVMVISLFPGDRKSTRLNSSHVSISYAVFCLKKKIHHQRAVAHCPTQRQLLSRPACHP